jgi:hypothetical protein
VTCPSLDVIAAFALDELAESELERFEHHYFECDVCLRRAERMHSLLAQLRAAPPPVLTAARRKQLEESAGGVRVVCVRPDERGLLELGPSAEVGVWLMQAPLADATRVDVEGRSAEGSIVFSFADVPFDPERGQVALLCHLHYRGLSSPELHVTVTAQGRDTGARVTRYVLDHAFADRA